MALNIAQEHLKKMDETYEDKPNKPEEINKVDNNAEVLECKVCEKKFWNEISSQNHDRNVHLTLGPGDNVIYKCDYCKSLQLTREQLFNHITNNHKRCTICAKVFSTSKSFEKHDKPNHHKATAKHTLEREPSLKNYKKTKNVIKLWQRYMWINLLHQIEEKNQIKT